MKRGFQIAIVILLILSMLCGCRKEQRKEGLGNGWEPVDRMKLDFATEFAVDYYQDGYKLISIGDGSRFLVVPEGKQCPQGIAGDIVPLYQPIENIYLAASAAMCLFDAMERLDTISLSGIRQQSWHIPNAAKAMEEGRILYAGKYSEPDYEMIMDYQCPLAVESTMIGHASEVKDKLEELGIAVLVDQSSMESHPLGRTEWMKLYAALLNEEEKAEALFQEQVQRLNEVLSSEDTGKSVAFFHISSSGYVVARKTGDYVSKMIEMAGGHYVFDNLGDPEKATSTVTIEMETFFATAKDADYIIYNSTIGGEIKSLEELLKKSDLLKEFKAVQNGNVWCTNQNMYQETTKLGEMVQSFHKIFSGEAESLDELPYLYRLH